MKAFSAYVHRNEVLHAYALARCTASPTVVVRGFILDCAMHGVDNASIAQHVGYMLDKMADLMKVMLAEEHRAKQDEAVAAYDCAVGGTFSATHSLPGLLHEKEQDAHGSAAEVETASAVAAAVEAQHPVRTATPEPVAARIRREEPKHLPVTPKRALLSPPMDLTQNTIMQQIDKEKLRKRNIPRVATIAAVLL
jgi:hypothetical protein